MNLNNMKNFTHGNGPFLVEPTKIFGPQRDSLLIVLPITIIYSIIFITGLLGNIFTCLIIIRNKNMHTATNYYLFSLAISDLLLLVSGMPQEIYFIWSKWPYVFGHSFCVIRGLAAETSTNASVLTITLFSVERYLAICRPFVSHKMSKLTRATKHVILLWLVALGLALPQALQFGLREIKGVVMCLQTRVIVEHSFEISTVCVFFAPMVLITVLYSLIGLQLKKDTVNTEHSPEKDLETNVIQIHKIQRKHSQSTKKVVKMLVAVVVAFFICWAPFHAQRLVAIYGTNEDHFAKTPFLLSVYYFLTYTSGVFYYMSTCVNPILYHIMSNRFREAFKNTMTQTCCRSKKRCSYTAMATPRNAASSGAANSGNSLRNKRNSNICHTPQKQDSRREDVPITYVYHDSKSLVTPAVRACKHHYSSNGQHVLKKEFKNTKNHSLKASLCAAHEISNPDCPVCCTHLLPTETLSTTPDAIVSEEKKDYVSNEPENHLEETELSIRSDKV